MNYIILLFGTLIAFGGITLLIKPDIIFSVFTKHENSIGLHLFAIIIRVVLGVALIIGASESRFPVILQVLGWLSITAALVLGVIGRTRFRNLIKWAINLAPPFRSLAGIFAVLFGGFLVYAVL